MDASVKAKENSALASCFEWVSMLIGALVTVVVIFALLFRVVGVSGDSMCNTLQSGDRLILITQFYKVERGDIIVVTRAGEEPYIKRVIAVAGDTIDIDDESGRVLLNGKAIEEEYVLGGSTTAKGFEGPYTVKDGEVFAMGDNRTWSLDCRQLGPFSTDEIAGEAVFRLFPFKAIGKI